MFHYSLITTLLGVELSSCCCVSLSKRHLIGSKWKKMAYSHILHGNSRPKSPLDRFVQIPFHSATAISGAEDVAAALSASDDSAVVAFSSGLFTMARSACFRQEML